MDIGRNYFSSGYLLPLFGESLCSTAENESKYVTVKCNPWDTAKPSLMGFDFTYSVSSTGPKISFGGFVVEVLRELWPLIVETIKRFQDKRRNGVKDPGGNPPN